MTDVDTELDKVLGVPEGGVHQGPCRYHEHCGGSHHQVIICVDDNEPREFFASRDASPVLEPRRTLIVEGPGDPNFKLPPTMPSSPSRFDRMVAVIDAARAAVKELATPDTPGALGDLRDRVVELES